MTAPLTIALDAMGGDFGPQVVIPGAHLSLIRHPDTRFIFFGVEELIAKELANFPDLRAQSEIVHTEFMKPHNLNLPLFTALT